LRAARLRTSKLPKPTKATLSPLASEPLMVLTTAFRAASESFLVQFGIFGNFVDEFGFSHWEGLLE
jgi:hypothetical protein